jgi:hypothetical protein
MNHDDKFIKINHKKMDAKLAMMMAKVKDGTLVCHQHFGNFKSDFKDFDLGLRSGEHGEQLVVWTEDGKRTRLELGGSMWTCADTALEKSGIDMSTVVGFAIDGDGLYTDYPAMREWTNCRYLRIGGSRCWALNAASLPPNLRVLDIVAAACNLGGLDFRLLDQACPELDLVLMDNPWDQKCSGGDCYEAMEESGFTAVDPDTHPLCNCHNVDYLNTAARNYAVYWVMTNKTTGTLGEYWEPRKGKHPLYFPQWRECVDPHKDNDWIVDAILENVPDIDQ